MEDIFISSSNGPLSSPAARKSLQRQVYLYEAALAQFPGSFKLWKSYLQTRMSFVLGKLVFKKKAGGRKKFPEMREALEDEAYVDDEEDIFGEITKDRREMSLAEFEELGLVNEESAGDDEGWESDRTEKLPTDVITPHKTTSTPPAGDVKMEDSAESAADEDDLEHCAHQRSDEDDDGVFGRMEE